MWLDSADKVASVISAVVGGLGIVLSIAGMRMQRRAAPPRPEIPLHESPRPECDDANTETTNGTASRASTSDEDSENANSELIIPSRNEWVPDSRNLPPGAPQGSEHPLGRADPDGIPPVARRRPTGSQPAGRGSRSLLVAGITLLALAASMWTIAATLL